MSDHSHHHTELPVLGTKKVRDPVCGMMIDPDRAAGKFDYQGQTYYFCNPSCLKKFQANPDVYISTPPTPSGQMLDVIQPTAKIEGGRRKAEGGNKYTCPMHPEIVRDGPGSCPICGMALEPMTITADEPDNFE